MSGDRMTLNVGTSIWALLVVSVLFVAAGARAAAQGGTVWAWGRNTCGQLGDGTNTDRWEPVEVLGLSAVASLAGGHAHSLALRSDGTVWTWGQNQFGQLGDGTNVDRWTPAQVPGLTDVIAVVGGYDYSLALRTDGTVWAWGANGSGQLGDGTTTERWTPVQVALIAGATGIAAGARHGLARASDDTVWTWGHNTYGQLGDGTTTDRCVPVQVAGLTGAKAVAAGAWHSIALRSDGTTWAWGAGDHGQLGDGANSHRTAPVQVFGLSGVTAIEGGWTYSLAVRLDGSVWAWGSNDRGQLGDGTDTERWTPVQVNGLAGVTTISGGSSHSLAAKSDGTVVAWGFNGDGELGDGTNADRWSPAEVSGSMGAAVIAGGLFHSLALRTPLPTTVYTVGRAGIISEVVTLRGYLRRLRDLAWLSGKVVDFKIDGTAVGSATTDANGRASLNWTITDGPATRTIAAEFAGDAAYLPSSGTATLMAQTISTKMWGEDRARMITDVAVLRAYLWRRDNVPVYQKTITFKIDGSEVGTGVTNAAGRAQFEYTVADGAGAGARTILAEWAGDGGYRSSACASTLYVQKAVPYIWVLSKSVPLGGTVGLYAYVRRLFDYRKQEGKPVTFSIDGTAIGTATTGSAVEPGVARCTYATVEPVGEHIIGCEFGGDAWLDAGFGEATLTVY